MSKRRTAKVAKRQAHSIAKSRQAKPDARHEGPVSRPPAPSRASGDLSSKSDAVHPQRLVALPALSHTGHGQDAHAPHRPHKRPRHSQETLALVAQRDALLRLQRATFVIIPVALFTLLAVALLPESRRVQGVVELWRADPQLAAQSVLGGMRDAPWVPVDGPEAVSRFEQEALGVSPGEPNFAIDVRDAVREVFLTRSRLVPTTAVAVADAIVEEADRAGYDPFLVLAIIEVESNFDPKALSYRGARGLMQLMPDTRAWMVQRDGLASDSDDVHDIRIGVRYLSLLHKGFGGRLERALQAYNCGPGKLLEVMHSESPMPEETRAYPGRVMKRFQKLKRDYAYLGSKVLTKQV